MFALTSSSTPTLCGKNIDKLVFFHPKIISYIPANTWYSFIAVESKLSGLWVIPCSVSLKACVWGWVCQCVTFCPGVYRNRQLGNGCLVASTTILDAGESSPETLWMLYLHQSCADFALYYILLSTRHCRCFQRKIYFLLMVPHLLCWKKSGRSHQALGNTRRRLWQYV